MNASDIVSKLSSLSSKMVLTNPAKLLEERDSHTDSSASPDLLLEQIGPLQNFKHDTFLSWVRPFLKHFLEFDFGHDSSPFGLNSVVACWKTA